RLIRVIGVLLLAARTLQKDLDAATREDLERLITTWMQRQPPYSPETLGTYKVIIKRFYTWLADPKGFTRRSNAAAIVAWINSHVQNKEKKRLQRNDLLTPEEIQRVITAARNLRDKALLSVLWETGGRIAEIGNRRINDVVPADVGCTIDVRG